MVGWVQRVPMIPGIMRHRFMQNRDRTSERHATGAPNTLHLLLYLLRIYFLDLFLDLFRIYFLDLLRIYFGYFVS